MSPKRPKLIAFDLDATLWYPEVDMLWGGPPFKQLRPGRIQDRRGERMELMGDSLTILQELATNPAWEGTQVAYVSRTDCPEVAKEALKTFEVMPGLSMYDFAAHHQIYPGRKTTHFQRIKQESGLDFDQMLFFDNERRNIVDCKPLGITCIYTPSGMTEAAWQQGLSQHAARG